MNPHPTLMPQWDLWLIAGLAGLAILWLAVLTLWEWWTRYRHWRNDTIPGYFGRVYGANSRANEWRP